MKIKAAVLYQSGLKPPYRDSKPLSIETVDLDPPEREEVLIKIDAAGLCHSDLAAIDGERAKPMPIVLGHETVGVVVEVGPGVTNVSAGDYVVPSFVGSCGKCEMCRIARPSLCAVASVANAKGTLMSGGRRLHKDGIRFFHHSGVSAFAEYAVVSEHAVVKVADDIPAKHAALCGCAVMTGAGAVMNTSGIETGQSLAVIGAGGVGLSAVMAAVAAGACQVIAIDLNEEKLKAATEFGADCVFNAKDPDVIEKVKAATGGGVHIAVESAGVPQALELAFNITRIGGKTIAAGLPNPERMVSISHFVLGAHERTLKGSYMGSCIPSRDIPRLLGMHRQGKLAIDKLAGKTIGFEDLNEAFDLMRQGEGLRCVLIP